MGRETYAYAVESGMSVKGFLDSDADALDGYPGYPPILCAVEDYVPAADDEFVCAIGDPEWKMKYVAEIAAKGGRFAKVIHPSSYIGHDVTIGDGCIVCPNCAITNDTVLGDHVIVNVGTSLNHDGRYGNGVTISPGCRVAGRCTVGERVFMGVGVTLIPDVVLGDGVYVAAGACVTKSFASGRIMGVPAILK